MNTYANEAAWTTAITPVANTGAPVVKDTLELAIAVRNARKLPGDVLILSVSRYGDYLGHAAMIVW